MSFAFAGWMALLNNFVIEKAQFGYASMFLSSIIG
jgi:hypothetical protein